MVTINELTKWDPAALGTAADALVRKRKALTDLQDEIDGAKPPPTWVAGSASGARAAHEKLRLRLLDLVAEVSDVSINLDDAQARITAAKNDLGHALSAAKAKGLEVDHATGRVSDPRTYSEDQEDQRNAMATEVSRVAHDVDAALMAAQEADLDLAKALSSAVEGKTDGGTGDLAHAAVQTPTSMDHLTPEQLAKMLGENVTIDSISAYLEVEAEFGSFDFKGKAQGDYKVAADGTTFLSLHLEGGLGREIEVGKEDGVQASASASAGATSDLELRFKTPEEAQEFLRNFKDVAFDDVNGWDAVTGQAAPEVAENVANYIKKQDISSFKVGVYGEAEGELKTPWAQGAIKGRADAYYDTIQDVVGLKLEGSATGAVGPQGEQDEAAAALSGEIKMKHGDFDSMTLTGKVSATLANQRMGLALPPHTSTGAGVEVQLVVDKDNPALDDIKTALGAGDVGRAKDLAFENGTVYAKETTIEQYKDQTADHEVDLGPLGKGKLKYGVTGETANQLWYRPAGRHQVIAIDPHTLPVNQ